jgi:DNA-binding transcriptional MerR regulator
MEVKTMFTVGDFARLAQVSKRLLRYYDEIGLFKPKHIDSSSGYRYYSAEQMSYLNRILALKELGFSLDQIRQTLSDNISMDELQGMLLLKKVEIEQDVRAELRRVRKIESRLQSIRDDESNKIPNVIIKQIPNQSVLSLRIVMEDFEAGMELYGQIQASIPRRLSEGLFFCICHSEHSAETNLDMEIGLIVNKPKEKSLSLRNGIILTQRELMGSQMMATTIVKGALETIHLGYAAITRWSSNNDYQLAGIPRELLLQLPKFLSGNDLVTEIQVPVEPLPEMNELDIK